MTKTGRSWRSLSRCRASSLWSQRLEAPMKSACGLAVVASLLFVPTPAGAEWGCVLYQHRDFGGAYWVMVRNSFMQMGGGEPMGGTNLVGYYRPDWNDQVSSFSVNRSRGCQLTLWQHAGTWGYGATFGPTSSSYSYVGSSWNDQASWAHCYCRGAPLH
jgi:hypothetical protein